MFCPKCGSPLIKKITSLLWQCALCKHQWEFSSSLPQDANPWQTLSQKVIYDNPWIHVEEHSVIHPDGNQGIYGVVHYKHYAIGILPVDDEGFTYLVGQYRYPLKRYSWEIPEGGGKVGESPLLHAKRELKEETGLVAEEWQPWLSMHLSNSVSDEWGIVFLARGLKQEHPQPEGSERLRLWRLPIEKAIEMVLCHQITDSLSVAALLKWAYLQSRGLL